MMESATSSSSCAAAIWHASCMGGTRRRRVGKRQFALLVMEHYAHMLWAHDPIEKTCMLSV